MKFEININRELRDEVFEQANKMNNTNLHNYANAMIRNASDIKKATSTPFKKVCFLLSNGK